MSRDILWTEEIRCTLKYKTMVHLGHHSFAGDWWYDGFELLVLGSPHCRSLILPCHSITRKSNGALHAALFIWVATGNRCRPQRITWRKHSWLDRSTPNQQYRHLTISLLSNKAVQFTRNDRNYQRSARSSANQLVMSISIALLILPLTIADW